MLWRVLAGLDLYTDRSGRVCGKLIIITVPLRPGDLGRFRSSARVCCVFSDGSRLTRCERCDS